MPSFIDLSKKSSYGATTAEDAVNNILYSASTSSRAKNRHMLSVLVDNQSGVLSKISGMLSSRGFNIDSLTVSKTNVAELLMIKVGTVPIELQAQHSPHSEKPAPADAADMYRKAMGSHNHREAVLQIAQVFNATVCDRGNEDMTFQLVSVPREVDGFMNMLAPFGVIEAVRSGVIAMNRSEVPKPGGDEIKIKKAVDLASLPPS